MRAPETPGNGGAPGRTGSEDLDQLVTEYIDRLNSGEELDPFEVLAAHPVRGPEILAQIEAYVDLEPDTPGLLGTFGDYTLRRQIGRGGMGVVYDAWQHSMDRQVALKVLPAGVGADRRACARFMREAQTAGQLHHPNVVRVYSTGFEEGTPWYSMEYVDGESLDGILARIAEAGEGADTPFGTRNDTQEYFLRLAGCFADVADGLQHAHSKGVTHRDIKPSNLILDAAGQLRILDFGLARLEGQESLTLSGDFVGTPLYMSPEQARRRKVPVGHPTDIYSLGATMYEALCGRPPFRGKDHADTLSRIIEHDPLEPTKRNARVPKDLETIVLKCLRKDPHQRYGTAEALAQDLRRFVRGDPVEARPQTRWEKLARRVRPYTRRIVIGAAVVALAGLAAGAFYLDAVKERRERIARTEQAVRQHLGDAERLWHTADPETRGLAKLHDALAAAETAAALARDGVAPSLRERARTLRETLQREVKNRDMLARLQELPAPTEHFEKRQAKHHAGFAETFREYGIDVQRLDPAVAAEKIRESGIEKELALALEIWFKLLTRPAEAGGSGRLMEVAMRADPHPWRNRLREAVLAADLGKVKRLAADVDVGRLSDRRIAFLSAHLYNRGEGDAAEALVRRAVGHLVHERSYWANYWLGFILKQKGQLEDSEDYLRHAVFSREDRRSGRARAHLGHVLTRRGRLDKAVEAHTRAFRYAPGDEASYSHIGPLLSSLEAVGEREALARVIRTLDEVVASGEAHPDARNALVRAWIRHPGALDAGRVLDTASSQVRLAREDGAEWAVQRALVLLARAQFAAGRPREAVRTLEAAERLYGSRKARIRQLLGTYRAAIAPDLASYASIDAALETGEVLVPRGAEWRYRPGREEPSSGLEWTRRDFDDSSWKSGPSGFGYGDGDDATRLDGMEGAYTTVYIRHRFTLPDPSRYARFWFSVHADDGCVAYVNGREVGRIRAGDAGEPLEATSVATAGAPEPSNPVPPVDLTIPPDVLEPGENLLAIQGLNWALDSSDLTLIPVLHARPRETPESRRPRFGPFRRAAERDGDDGRARLAYLDGRLHARSGEHRKAAAAFREVLELDPGRPEPYVRLAESLHAAGETAAAGEVLRELLERVDLATTRDWNRWLAFHFVHLERSPAAMLEGLPDDRGGASYTDDLRWLLERLAGGEVVRINCGGEAYRSVGGARFGRDRFYVLGRPIGDKTYSDKIARTDDDILYASWRYFPPVYGIPVGYAVPAPPGRYRVTLHFAMVYPPTKALYAEGAERPPPRVTCDVVAEGTRVLEGFAPQEYGTAVVKRFETVVEDGVFHLRLMDRQDGSFVPTIEGIEIEKLD